MFLLGELLYSWRRECLWNGAFLSESIDVGKLVDAHRVLLVESDTVESLDGGSCFVRIRVFDESKAESVSQESWITRYI